MPKDRITILRNKEIYPSYEVAVSALNRYAETNSLLDGEPVLGRYYDDEGVVQTILAVCVVLEREDGCITKEQLNIINNDELIKSLSKVAYTGKYSDLTEKLDITITGEGGVNVVSSGLDTTEPKWDISLNMPDIVNNTVGGVLVSDSFKTKEQADESRFSIPVAMLENSGVLVAQRPDNIVKEELSESLLAYISELASGIKTTDEFEFIKDGDEEKLSLVDNKISFMRLINPYYDSRFTGGGEVVMGEIENLTAQQANRN